MLKSMTGYGTATVESNTLSVTAEVKSLNSKFLDIFCRIPRNYSEREIEIRNMLTAALERGKVELTLTVQSVGDVKANTTVNRPLVQAYFKDLYQTAQSVMPFAEAPDPTDLFKIALQMPNAYNTNSIDESRMSDERSQVQAAVKQAIEKCDAFRIQEGLVTARKFEEYIQRIADAMGQVIALDANRMPALRERLNKAVSDLIGDENLDRNRFEQELIYYAEKFDISEEKVRLQNHLTYFTEVLRTEGSGKKLNFIAQEIGREINTIGSKANDADMQRVVVQMKDELEKIKEQTANIL